MGATLTSQTVSEGVTVVIASGGTASGGTLGAAASASSSPAARSSTPAAVNRNLNVNSGGTFAFAGVDLTGNQRRFGRSSVKPGAIIELLSGTFISGAAVSAFTAEVFSGSTAAAMTVASGGVLEVFAGGSASGTSVGSGGTRDRVRRAGLSLAPPSVPAVAEIVSAGDVAASRSPAAASSPYAPAASP